MCRGTPVGCSPLAGAGLAPATPWCKLPAQTAITNAWCRGHRQRRGAGRGASGEHLHRVRQHRHAPAGGRARRGRRHYTGVSRSAAGRGRRRGRLKRVNSNWAQVADDASTSRPGARPAAAVQGLIVTAGQFCMAGTQILVSGHRRRVRTGWRAMLSRSWSVPRQPGEPDGPLIDNLGGPRGVLRRAAGGWRTPSRLSRGGRRWTALAAARSYRRACWRSRSGRAAGAGGDLRPVGTSSVRGRGRRGAPGQCHPVRAGRRRVHPRRRPAAGSAARSRRHVWTNGYFALATASEGGYKSSGVGRSRALGCRVPGGQTYVESRL